MVEQLIIVIPFEYTFLLILIINATFMDPSTARAYKVVLLIKKFHLQIETLSRGMTSQKGKQSLATLTVP